MARTENEMKIQMRLDINLNLLVVCFTVFALIISLNPSLFRHSLLIPIQLTMAIPLLLSSIFARSKMASTERAPMWERYSFLTFLISYSFLINVLGMLLAVFISPTIGLVFFLFNIFMAAMYSTFEIIENRHKLPFRVLKDLLFFALILFGGILPALGVY